MVHRVLHDMRLCMELWLQPLRQVVLEIPEKQTVSSVELILIDSYVI